MLLSDFFRIVAVTKKKEFVKIVHSENCHAKKNTTEMKNYFQTFFSSSCRHRGMWLKTSYLQRKSTSNCAISWRTEIPHRFFL